jgi:hypothetical protein
MFFYIFIFQSIALANEKYEKSVISDKRAVAFEIDYLENGSEIANARAFKVITMIR